MELYVVIIILALGLAMDSFAVAVAQGSLPGPLYPRAIRVGLVFGLMQGVLPLLGWLLGAAFLPLISTIGPWAAFIVLGLLGLKMLNESRGGNEIANILSGSALWVAAFATSIDAFAAGVTMPSLGLPAAQSCIVIGMITAVLSAAGTFIGRAASRWIGKYAEIAGGLVLIGLGIKILVEHLSADG